MSLKAVMEVPIDEVRPSPYQPRLTFDVDTLKESIKRDGMLAGIIVREKPGRTRYELIDGERRWRTAKELGWKSVPAEVRQVNDETALRIIYTLNEERQPYSAEENTKFFRKMYDNTKNVLKLSDTFNKANTTIWNYINVSVLPDQFQKAVWSGKITMGSIQELEPLFAEARDEIGDISNVGNYQNSPAYQRIIALCERLYTGEIKGRDELRQEYVTPYLDSLEKKRIERAKEEIERVVPKAKVEAKVRLETPQDYEKVAKVLRKKAREMKSPQERRKEMLQTAQTLLESVKLEKASEVGIEVKPYGNKLREVRSYLNKEPERAVKELRKVKRELESKVKEEKLRKEVTSKVRREVEQEVMKDTAFIKRAADLAPTITEEVPKEEMPAITTEQVSEIQSKMDDTRRRISDILNDPQTRKKGKLFRNWLAHQTMVSMLGSAFCPIGGEEGTLVWKCHDLPLEKAFELAHDKYQDELEK